MENLIFLLSAVFTYNKLSTPKKFVDVTIDAPGTSVLLPSDFKGFNKTVTLSGDEFYIGECFSGKAGYGVLYIKLKERIWIEDAETMLSYYISRLQEPFNIAHNTGIGYCISIDQEKDNRKLVDYWQDELGIDWKLKGYTNGKFIAVLYVQNISEIDVDKQDLFLDSLQFPE
jgi:hypothetical protein